MKRINKVFAILKKDEEFLEELIQTDQVIPWMPGPVEKAIWCAGYDGWILGRHGPHEYKHRTERWKD